MPPTTTTHTPVLDSTIHHRERGSGPPFVLLHGNPTSSYLWRKVLPRIDGARLLAPDLIGMGDSGKPDIDHTFDDHATYLEAWFDAVGLTGTGSDGVVLVGHDWGGALAFDYAARHPGRVRAIAFTETIVKPMAWEEFPEGGRALFRAIRTAGTGEALILDRNAMIEGMSDSGTSPLAAADLAEYRRPYPTRESRRPLLAWPRAMPLGGEPADVVARIEAYDAWLASTPEVPKLLIDFAPAPGAMMSPDLVAWCKHHIAALEVAHHKSPSGHHTPEDRPTELATSLSTWSTHHNLRTPQRRPI